MLSDPAAAEAVVFGPGGVLEGVKAGKGYVDMSTGAPRTRRAEQRAWRGHCPRCHTRARRRRAMPRRAAPGSDSDAPLQRGAGAGCAAGAFICAQRASRRTTDPSTRRCGAVDADTSRKIGAAITAKGGRFLEAPVSGSKKPAIGAPPLSLLHCNAPWLRVLTGSPVVVAAQTGSW